jgi:hypothetical protein
VVRKDYDVKQRRGNPESIEQLEGDKQVRQKGLRMHYLVLFGYRSFQTSSKALYIFRYAAKRCASFKDDGNQKHRPEKQHFLFHFGLQSRAFSLFLIGRRLVRLR